ncbi:HlyD family efflux transporter periplasmic adaptor subunit [Streptomyces sp. NRRL F-525]|uniref:HlyD family efflux transporter periplasmic adaptor subunit n=1 Tax=Streptomyces sp. NRRL F-525 TaxID=1463861 RepID=UPI000690D5CD|nr:HlyD family efflux transporter periplasmic adaptor subunit [Streptomyces sp. NRRL F-525]
MTTTGDDNDGTRSRRGSRRLKIGAVALAGVTATALGVTVWQDGNTKPSTTAADSARVGTATVIRTDLSDAQTLSGTLGYSKAAPVKGAKAGLVTWLPAPGARVTRGHALYKVDNVPVPVFYGATPLYRALNARGMTGPDVRVVADNLKRLGYDIGSQPAPGTWVAQHPAPAEESGKTSTDRAAPAETPTPTPTATATATSVKVKEGDGVLTADLIAAVRRWQTYAGMPATGVLGIGDVVVQPGEVRVGAVQAQTGDDANGSLMTVSSTTKKVSVPVDATRVGTMARGNRVTVTLPDNSTVTGTVEAVGATATATDNNDGDTSGGGGPAQLTVTVRVPDAGAVARLTSAPVQVAFTSRTRKGVLAVPVGALLALSEGGYAVQLPGGRLLAVRTGMFAKGLVEVTGDGLTAGLKVVTTS